MALRTNFTSFRAALPICLAILLAACSSPEAQKKQHFEQGNKYAAEKRDDFAVIEYANAVRIDSKFGEARLKLAETYERMNNLRAAIPEFIRAADALPDNRDVQIKASQLLILVGRFEDAKARTTALLAKNPKDVDALLLRANALAALKDPSGAIEEVEEALRVEPTESRALVSLGAIRMQSGQKGEAEAAFKQAITLQPGSVEARIAYANFLWSTAQPTDAEREIKQALTLQPRHLLANRMLAALYQATNRLGEAEPPLKLVAEVSAAPGAKFELAQFYAATRRPDQATKILSGLAAGKDTFARAETMLAAIEYEGGRKQQAMARLNKVLERAPRDTAALVMKARWLTSDQKLDEAVDAAKAAVAAEPRSAMAQYTLGVVHTLRGDTSEAVKYYTEALRLNPRFRSAQIQLSRINLARGDREAAFRFAQEAQVGSANVDAGVALVRSLIAKGDLTRAEAEVKELLRTWPNTSSVHAVNGTLRAMRKDNAGSRAAFTKALELAPDNIDALGGLIAVDLNEKRFTDAAAKIEAELAKQPDRPDLLSLAAAVYDRAGQKDRAEQALRHAVTANPQFVSGYALLAQLYLNQKRLDEARGEFETILKRDPKAVGARTMVGIILEAQGKRDEAKRWYETTVADLPSAAIAANNLAFMYADEGKNLDVALSLASNAKKQLQDSAEVDDTLGWIYYKKDLPSLAVAPLEESLKKKPTSATILYHVGVTYAKLGDKAKSRDALERALKLGLRPADAQHAKQILATVAQ
jgi:putative PEP-CTERM system TPR-repeat lipoprotein